MIIPNFREFRPRIKDNLLKEIAQYLTVDMIHNFKILTLGLTKLSFADNFDSFEVEVTIAAGQELAIRNELGEAVTKRMIVRGGADAQNIVDGTTEWTSDFVYLTNVGTITTTATVVFLK